MDKINLSQKLSLFNDYWNPRIIGELNGQFVKLAKFKGEFDWHFHENEDELFMVIEGEFIMEFRDKKVLLKESEIIIIPKGVEHRPVAEKEVSILLFEPKELLNTGNIINEKTKEKLEKI